MEQQPRPERSQRSHVVRWALTLSLCLLLALGGLAVYTVRSRAARPTCAASCPILLYGSTVLGPTAGAAEGQLTGIRQSDGATLWNTPLTDFGTAYVAKLVSGEAYLATRNCVVRPCTNWMIALRVRDGLLLWHVQISGTVFHMTADSVGVYAESLDDTNSASTFYALRASDGASLWHVPADMLDLTPLAASEGMVYIAATDMAFHYSLLAVRDETGISVFHVSLPQLFAVAPSSTGVIYASINHSPGSALIYAISTRDGAILWQQTLPPSQVHGGWEYLSLTASALVVIEPYNVYALDRTSGAIRWHYHVPATFAIGTADSAHVYLLLTLYPNGLTGARITTTTLRALDPHTGASLWSQSTGFYNQDFTVASGSLLVSQISPSAATCSVHCEPTPGPTKVCALDSATGAASWCARQPFSGQILAAQ